MARIRPATQIPALFESPGRGYAPAPLPVPEPAMSKPVLVIGNKRYSSWSLRPWLAMKQAGLAFEEIVIPLYEPDSKRAILAHSPAGKVPVLHDGDVTVWDSIAILEHLAERRPELLPEAGPARALCRSISAEMHSGFAALRQELPMDVVAHLPGRSPSTACEADLARLRTVWEEARTRFGAQGPFLFGRFTIADAMYAPVCTRLRTYAIPLDGVPAAYVDAMLDLPAMRDWYAAAREEPWTLDV